MGNYPHIVMVPLKNPSLKAFLDNKNMPRPLHRNSKLRRLSFCRLFPDQVFTIGQSCVASIWLLLTLHHQRPKENKQGNMFRCRFCRISERDGGRRRLGFGLISSLIPCRIREGFWGKSHTLDTWGSGAFVYRAQRPIRVRLQLGIYTIANSFPFISTISLDKQTFLYGKLSPYSYGSLPRCAPKDIQWYNVISVHRTESYHI